MNLKEALMNTRGQEISTDKMIYTCIEEETNFNLNSKDLPSFPIQQESKVEDLMEWYIQNYPQLCEEENLDYHLLTQMNGPYIRLKKDIELLLRNLTDQGIPDYSEEHEDWKAIATQIASSFPYHQKYILSFFKYSFQSKSKAKVDLKSVPPIGRYLATPERKDPRGPIRRNHRDSRGPDRKNHHGDDNKSHDQAVSEAVQGMSKLKKDKKLKVLSLAPQNSLVRRLQHKKIVDSGFNSQSKGEGQDRHVQIVKK